MTQAQKAIEDIIRECQHDARWQSIKDEHIEAIIKWVAEYHPLSFVKYLPLKRRNTDHLNQSDAISYELGFADCEKQVYSLSRPISEDLGEIEYEDAYDRACMDACFCLGMDPREPPKSLDQAIGMIRGLDTLPQKQSIYATFAKHFQRARVRRYSLLSGKG